METITIDNFFVKSKGVWDEIKEIPEGFENIFQSKSSAYYTNKEKTHIVRTSDHWGYFIRECDWHLKEHPEKRHRRISAYKFQKKNGKTIRIGIIHLSNLTHNNDQPIRNIKKTIIVLPKSSIKGARKIIESKSILPKIPKKYTKVESNNMLESDHWGAKIVNGKIEIYDKDKNVLRTKSL